MRNWHWFCLVVFLLLGMPKAVVRAELYTWTDEQGNVHLSEVPPTGKKAKRFTVDKGCTLLKHVPGMTHNDLSRFMANMFNTPYKRENMTGVYRDLFDDVEKTNAACNAGDDAACECWHGRAETKGMSFAPIEPGTERKGGTTRSETGTQSGQSNRPGRKP